MLRGARIGKPGKPGKPRVYNNLKAKSLDFIHKWRTMTETTVEPGQTKNGLPSRGIIDHFFLLLGKSSIYVTPPLIL